MGELLMIVMITCYNMHLFIWNSPNSIIYWLIRQENRSKVPYGKGGSDRGRHRWNHRGRVADGATYKCDVVQVNSLFKTTTLSDFICDWNTSHTSNITQFSLSYAYKI